MTVTAKTLIEEVQIPNAATTEYTVPNGTRTIIDKCTVTNPTASAASFTINLVPNGSSAGAANEVIHQQTVAAGTVYLCPEVVGHVLATGDFVSTVASSAATLNLRMSGREVV